MKTEPEAAGQSVKVVGSGLAKHTKPPTSTVTLAVWLRRLLVPVTETVKEPNWEPVIVRVAVAVPPVLSRTIVGLTVEVMALKADRDTLPENPLMLVRVIVD